MTAYILAQFRVTDPARFRQFSDATLAVLKRFDARLLALCDQPKTIVGESTATYVAITAFPDEETAQAFLHSPDFQMLSVLREAGATSTTTLIMSGDAPDLV